MYPNIESLTEENKEIYKEFLQNVLKTSLKDRLRAALLFEIFEEGINLYEENIKFNDDEHQKYDDKITDLTDTQDKIITGESTPTFESLGYWKENVDQTFLFDPANVVKAPISEFWMKFFDHNDLHIGEADLPILKHLEKIEITK